MVLFLLVCYAQQYLRNGRGKSMVYLQLFIAFLQIGALSFGGGYAAMPLIQAQVIDRYGWMNMADFSNLVAIAEMTPGPIAVNAATFVGNQVGGFWGAIIATIGVILPSCIIILFLAVIYNKYKQLNVVKGTLATLRPAVISFIFVAGLSIFIPVIFNSTTGNVNIRMIIYFVIATIMIRTKRINPIMVMLGCGAAELIITIFTNL